MNTRQLGKTGAFVSEIGLGTWQLGTKWGDEFNPVEAEKILNTAYENGINIIDTADVYNDGESEKAIGKFMKKMNTDFYVVTKCGRALNPHTEDMYTPNAIENFVDGSIKRLQVEKIDMILLHCPPSSVYQRDDIFTKLDKLQKSGKLGSYGVSVEKVSEAVAAMDYNVSAIEVIFNMFRLKPQEELFTKARLNNVGILARVPLASGLLTGRYSNKTVFGEKDHRQYNRNGESFDKGETFSGVDFATGLQAVEELKKLFHTENLVPYALKWILMHKEVTTVIPGASNSQQVLSNLEAENMDDLTPGQMQGVKDIYNKYIRESVHNNW